ncbi:hypothetical protein WH47_01319, partial [Habropoda laboriosa]
PPGSLTPLRIFRNGDSVLSRMFLVNETLAIAISNSRRLVRVVDPGAMIVDHHRGRMSSYSRD